MIRTRSLFVLILAIAGLTVCAAAQAGPHHQCSNRMIKGMYGFTCSGSVVTPTGNIPFALIGTVTSDGKGHFEGPGTMNINGTIMPQYASTNGPNAQPAVVNPEDCTGTITYETYTANPNLPDSVDLGPLPINFVVMDNGDEIRGMPTTPGYVVTCQLIRVHQPE